MQKLAECLRREVGGGCVFEQESMSRHTTFRIGGPADIFVSPTSAAGIIAAVRLCQEHGVPYRIIGNGSNLLVSDEGWRGVIVQLYRNFSDIQVRGEYVTAQAGAMLSVIAKKALEAGLTGFEFASGIPGTLGGAVVMNAGAYGREMKDVLVSVTVMTKECTLQTFTAEEAELGYRTSAVEKNGWTVIGAKLRLQRGDREQIRSLMEDLRERRTSKQPLELPSAGSTFKRPEGYFAGKLIMDAGLRGYSVGGAQVSEKHCGFVVNRGGATAEDVRNLIYEVIRRVHVLNGVTLEPEVRMLGEFHDALSREQKQED